MSLTTFIKEPVIRHELRTTFPTKPKFDFDDEMLAPPESRRYSLVGTAFDYVIRFYLEHLNPSSVTKPWVAHSGVDVLIDCGAPDPLIEASIDAVRDAEELKAAFVESGNFSDDLLRAALRLAPLDAVFRTGRYEESWLSPPATEDVLDMARLASLLPRQSWLVASDHCVLNPTFGRASTLVGGADADILIDNMLVEIKTTKRLRFSRDHFNQLLGYLTLQRIGGIGPFDSGKNVIQCLGVYYARHGILAYFPLKGFVDGRRLRGFTGYIQWVLEERWDRWSGERAHYAA